jgi:hypothetical protein
LSTRIPAPHNAVTAGAAGVACSVNLKAYRRHILMYTAWIDRRNSTMQRRAKVFMNNRSQAVRLPKEFQFSTDE